MLVKFRRRRSPAARGNRLGRFQELGRTLLGVMCRSGVTRGGGTAVSSGTTRGAALEQWSASGGVAIAAGGGAVARQRRQRRKRNIGDARADLQNLKVPGTSL
jgi:hypothetical protein